MAIKLNLEPTENLTYKRTVAIPTPDGNPLKVEFTFKHRTRVQVGELFEGYMARAKAAAEKEAEVGAESDHGSLREFAEAAVGRDVDAVLDVATNWNIDLPFNAENLFRFLNAYAGAAVAITTDYRVSLTEGRLGN